MNTNTNLTPKEQSDAEFELAVLLAELNSTTARFAKECGAQMKAIDKDFAALEAEADDIDESFVAIDKALHPAK